MATLTPLVSGPWRRVNDTEDPYDDQPDELVDAKDGYLVSFDRPGGFYQRAGFNQSGPPTFSAGPYPGAQTCLYDFAVGDGTYLRFLAVGGFLFRFTYGVGTTWTDVTPSGVTISNGNGTTTSPTTRYYMTQLNGQLVFTDGVNPVWLGTDLTSTPITATTIDVDGAGGTYAIQGQPTLYQGSLVIILKSVGTASLNTQAGVGFLWSEPNQPSVGYEQSGYANFFNYIQTGAEPLTACWGTNEGLYLFRERSIGMAVGPLANLQSSPTTATIGVNVGTTSPACMVQFGPNIFFVDRLGRPYMLTIGANQLADIWQQMRGQFDRNPTYLTSPTANSLVAVAVVEPQRNIAILAPFSSAPSGVSGNTTPGSPTVGFAFDAATGVYMGTWSVGAGTTWESVSVFHDADNNPVMGLCTYTAISFLGPTSSYVLWVQFLWSDNQWGDNAVYPTPTVENINPYIQTGRLGYSEEVTWNCRKVTAISMSQGAGTLTVVTPYQSGTTEGTVTPTGSDDSTYRSVFGTDVRTARGMQFKITAGAAVDQWGIQRVTALATPRRARVDDA